MKRIVNRKNILVTVVAILFLPVVLYVIWWTTAGVRGQLMARYDMARGHYNILQYGLPMAPAGEYRALMLHRYAVDIHFKGCVGTEISGPYSRAYNRVVVSAVNKKFGRDVFKEGWEDATNEMVERLSRNREGSAGASEEAHPASSR